MSHINDGSEVDSRVEEFRELAARNDSSYAQLCKALALGTEREEQILLILKSTVMSLLKKKCPISLAVEIKPYFMRIQNIVAGITKNATITEDFMRVICSFFDIVREPFGLGSSWATLEGARPRLAIFADAKRYILTGDEALFAVMGTNNGEIRHARLIDILNGGCPLEAPQVDCLTESFLCDLRKILTTRKQKGDAE